MLNVAAWYTGALVRLGLAWRQQKFGGSKVETRENGSELTPSEPSSIVKTLDIGLYKTHRKDQVNRNHRRNNGEQQSVLLGQTLLVVAARRRCRTPPLDAAGRLHRLTGNYSWLFPSPFRRLA